MKKLLPCIICLIFVTTTFASKYDEARELYKQGPSKGNEVVVLLQEHLAEMPEDEAALRLLAVTLFGLKRSSEALPIIDKALALAEKRDSISAQMLMLKARSLYDLERFEESNKILEVYWGFWQGDDELLKLYNWYYPQTLERIKEKNANQKLQPTVKTPVESGNDQGTAGHP